VNATRLFFLSLTRIRGKLTATESARRAGTKPLSAGENHGSFSCFVPFFFLTMLQTRAHGPRGERNYAEISGVTAGQMRSGGVLHWCAAVCKRLPDTPRIKRHGYPPARCAPARNWGSALVNANAANMPCRMESSTLIAPQCMRAYGVTDVVIHRAELQGLTRGVLPNTL